MNGQNPGMGGALCGQGLQRLLDLGKGETEAPQVAVGTPDEIAPWSANRSADKPVWEQKCLTAYQHFTKNLLVYRQKMFKKP